MANDSRLRICSHFHGGMYEAATGPFASDENPDQDEVLAGAGDGFGSIIFRILFGDGGVGGVECAPSSTDKAVVRWLGTDGCRIQNSAVIISDTDDITVPGVINAGSGGDPITDAAGKVRLDALEGHDTDGDVLTWDDTAGEAVWAAPSGGGGGGAPDDAQYVTLATDGDLDNERVLTGTANQVIITDNGAGNTVVLSAPQDIHAGASPTFNDLTLTGAVTVGGIITAGSTPVTLTNAAGRALLAAIEPGSTNGHVITYNSGTGLAEWAAPAGTVGGSGTTGKIPKFSASATLADSVMSESVGVITVAGGEIVRDAFQAGGEGGLAVLWVDKRTGTSRVGINTNSPSAALHVVGALKTSAGATIDGGLSVGSTTTMAASLTLSAGNITLTSGFINQDSWTAPTLENSWANFGGSHTQAGYRKNKNGNIELRGRVKDGSVGAFAVFTLPVGFRPASDVSFAVVTSTGMGRLVVRSGGAVELQTGSNTFANLDGIFFEAA